MKFAAAIVFLALPTAVHAADGNSNAGAMVFKKCAACHSVDEPINKVGPHLVGVVDRHAASVADYNNYSDSLKQEASSGLKWDEATLATFLAGPKKRVPKTRMAFSGLKSSQDIADVIAYLKSRNGQ